MKKIDWLLILLITCLGIGLRLYHLEYPKTQVFDEIYYSAAAKTYLTPQIDPNHGHPPLGKLLIAWGMDYTRGQVKTFSWRFAGFLFGSLMIPLAYLAGLLLAQSTLVASLSALFLALDFLQLVQSRIAMLDIFSAFFSLLGFVLLWVYFYRSKSSSPWLCLSALSFGLSLASKWNGFFAALGAIFCFWAMPREEKNARTKIRETLIFILIFAATYLFSYIPWLLKGVGWDKILTYHAEMVQFHYQENFKHNYLSYFWQWPTLIRPIWYYYHEASQKVYGIFATGSPFFWWSFLLAFPWLLDMSFKKEETAVRFALIAYLSQFLLWALAFKGAFFYYILPSVPWMAVCLALGAGKLWKSGKLAYKCLVVLFIAGTVLIFALYYPLLIAFPISKSYYGKLIFLKNWI